MSERVKPETAPEKISLQDFADGAVAPGYRQTLKTAQEVVAINCWRSAEEPWCCDAEVDVTSMLGSPYFAECKTCGKWAASVDGPHFVGAAVVQFLDPNKVDLDTDATWIVGVGEHHLKDGSR